MDAGVYRMGHWNKADWTCLLVREPSIPTLAPLLSTSLLPVPRPAVQHQPPRSALDLHKYSRSRGSNNRQLPLHHCTSSAYIAGMWWQVVVDTKQYESSRIKSF